MGFYFSQTSVIIFAWDLAAFRIIGMSVIAGCPKEKVDRIQGTSLLKGHLPWSRGLRDTCLDPEGAPLNRDSTVLVLIVYHTGQAQMDWQQTVFCFTRLPI